MIVRNNRARIFVFLLLMISCVVSQQDNIIVNGDFEGGSLEGWECAGGGASVYVADQDNLNLFINHLLKLSGHNSKCSQNVDVEPNQEYMVCFKAYTSSASVATAQLSVSIDGSEVKSADVKHPKSPLKRCIKFKTGESDNIAQISLSSVNKGNNGNRQALTSSEVFFDEVSLNSRLSDGGDGEPLALSVVQQMDDIDAEERTDDINGPPVAMPSHKKVDTIISGRGISTRGHRPANRKVNFSPRNNNNDSSSSHNERYVFSPDGRTRLWDAGYPWGNVGRVVGYLPNNQVFYCAGTLVGPRHVLTAAHCLPWGSDGSLGAISFSPSYPNVNRGTAWAIMAYYYVKIGSSLSMADSAKDYAVLVLNSRMGDSLGWLGVKPYCDCWNGGNYWAHVGYPGDLGGATYPFWENGYNWFDTDDYGDAKSLKSNTMDITKGDSGGPSFAWWSDGVYVVSVTSGDVAVWNSFSYSYMNLDAGGGLMPTLVIQAQSEYP